MPVGESIAVVREPRDEPPPPRRDAVANATSFFQPC